MTIQPTLLLIGLLSTASAALGQVAPQVVQKGRFSAISLEKGELLVTGFGGTAAWGETERLNFHEFSSSLILSQARQGSFLIFAQALGRITFSRDGGRSWKHMTVPGYLERTKQLQILEDGVWLIGSQVSLRHLNRRGEVLRSYDPPAPGLGVRDALWHRQRCWLLTFDGDLWSLDAGQWQQHTIQGNQTPVVFLPGAEREEPDIVSQSGAIYRAGRWWWSSDFRDLPSRAPFVRTGPFVYASYVETERVCGQHRVLHVIRVLVPKANRVDLSPVIQLPVAPAAVALEKQGNDYRIAVANASQPFDVRASEDGTDWHRLGLALLNPQISYPASTGSERGKGSGESPKNPSEGTEI